MPDGLQKENTLDQVQQSLSEDGSHRQNHCSNTAERGGRSPSRPRISLAKEDIHRAGEAVENTIINPTLGRVLPVLLVLVAFYYAIGMATSHIIDDDLSFRPAYHTQNGYYSIDMAAALIAREVDIHGWKANNPFYVPSALLDNMPNFQIGMFNSLHAFVEDFSAQYPESNELAKAADSLGYDATRWYYQLSDPTAMPQPPAEDIYNQARAALLEFNMKHSKADVIWKPQKSELARLLEHAADRFLMMAQKCDNYLYNKDSNFFRSSADNMFYKNKGRLYGHSMILAALERDFDPVLAEEKSLLAQWDHMLQLVNRAAVLSPLIVTDGAPDSIFPPSHLSAQGFAILNAERAIRTMAQALSPDKQPNKNNKNKAGDGE